MYYTVYVSSASKLFTEDQLQTLVNTCNKNNIRMDITGVMLYNEGNFIQVLEGDKESIINLYKVIERDQRHYGMLKLIEGDLENRNFPDWSMGFKIISAIEYSKFEDFVHLKERLSQAESHTAITLLKSFSEL